MPAHTVGYTSTHLGPNNAFSLHRAVHSRDKRQIRLKKGCAILIWCAAVLPIGTRCAHTICVESFALPTHQHTDMRTTTHAYNAAQSSDSPLRMSQRKQSECKHGLIHTAYVWAMCGQRGCIGVCVCVCLFMVGNSNRMGEYCDVCMCECAVFYVLAI